MEEEGGREGSHPEQSTRSARGSPASKLSLHTTTPRTQEGDRRTHVTPHSLGANGRLCKLSSTPPSERRRREGH